jgi:hypothetical protein
MLSTRMRKGLKAIPGLATIRDKVRETAGFTRPRAQTRLHDEADWVNDIIEKVTPYTMTSPERLAALCRSVEYVARYSIPGDLVECGVWRGGSAMAAALSFLQSGVRDRRLFLFDTYEGMSEPTEHDLSPDNVPAKDLLTQSDRSSQMWAYCPLPEVKANLATIAYPSERIVFVPGKVEDTIPGHAPERIALLRLDTDWYTSTKHELDHLYDRLAVGGVLIIDDYGHWQGARQAVDEFVEARKLRILLHRVDYTCRIAIKQ